MIHTSTHTEVHILNKGGTNNFNVYSMKIQFQLQTYQLFDAFAFASEISGDSTRAKLEIMS